MKNYMFRFLIVLFSLSLLNSSFAAFNPTDSAKYHLQLKNKKYTFEYALYEGDYIIFDTEGGERHRGNVEKITPTDITVDGKKFKIKDLRYIKKTRKKLRNWSIGTSIPTIITIASAIISLNLDNNGGTIFNGAFGIVIGILGVLSYLTLITAIILWLILLTGNVFNANLEKFDVVVRRDKF